MKKSLITQCLTLLIIIFFCVNFLSLSLFNGKELTLIKNSSFEQILSVLQMPTDLISKMMDNNSSKQTNNTKKDKEENLKFLEYLLPVTFINFSSIANSFNIYPIKHLANSIYIYFVTEIDYPIKIPFLRCIFLLLLLKLIFSILKRSISINYNMINIDKRACIV